MVPWRRFEVWWTSAFASFISQPSKKLMQQSRWINCLSYHRLVTNLHILWILISRAVSKSISLWRDPAGISKLIRFTRLNVRRKSILRSLQKCSCCHHRDGTMAYSELATLLVLHTGFVFFFWATIQSRKLDDGRYCFDTIHQFEGRIDRPGHSTTADAMRIRRSSRYGHYNAINQSIFCSAKSNCRNTFTDVLIALLVAKMH